MHLMHDVSGSLGHLCDLPERHPGIFIVCQGTVVLQRLRKPPFREVQKKCHVAHTTIEFLGHQISPKYIAVDLEKTTVLHSWQTPHRGLAITIKHLLPRLPQSLLLKKRVQFTRGLAKQHVFEVLRKAFAMDPSFTTLACHDCLWRSGWGRVLQATLNLKLVFIAHVSSTLLSIIISSGIRSC